MKYSVGDEVIIKVDDLFDYGYKIYTPLKVVVLGFDSDCDSDYGQYLCYIPCYESIPYGFKTFKIGKQHVIYLGIDPKFLDETACFITAQTQTYRHIPAPVGESCIRCKTWCAGAEKTDGVYKCRDCRENPYR